MVNLKVKKELDLIIHIKLSKIDQNINKSIRINI